MKYLWIILMCISINSYSADLPLVTVQGSSIIIETEGELSGYKIMKEFDNSFMGKILLLAAYINTQSRGRSSDLGLADKFGVAQAIMNRFSQGYTKCKDLPSYFLKHSHTIKSKTSRYFWVDSQDYYSSMCILAAYKVLREDIPEEYNIGFANSFCNESKVKKSYMKGKIITKKWKHSFYYSKRWLKKYNKHKNKLT